MLFVKVMEEAAAPRRRKDFKLDQCDIARNHNNLIRVLKLELDRVEKLS